MRPGHHRPFSKWNPLNWWRDWYRRHESDRAQIQTLDEFRRAFERPADFSRDEARDLVQEPSASPALPARTPDWEPPLDKPE